MLPAPRRAAGRAGVALLVVGLVACETLTELVEPRGPEVRAVEGVTTDVAAIVGTFASGPRNRPYLLDSMTEFDRHYGGVDPGHEASHHVRAFFQNGGRRIWVLRVDEATGAALVGNGVSTGGLAALNEANRFDLLLVPELFTSTQVPNRALAAATAIAYAASRGAMMFVDPPAEAESAASVIDWVGSSSSNLRDRHAVTYFGRIEVREEDGSGGTRWIGASGAAAGIYAANDRQRGVWASPAGNNAPALAGVLGVQPLTSDEMAALTAANINPLNDAPARLWGARTLAGSSSEFAFIGVQRLTLHIEALVRETLAWTAGQSSDDPLWQHARSQVESALDGLWRRGAFQGTKPEEGYFVRSDVTTHTAADIAAGRLNVVVGFAPLRPAEFVVRTTTLEL